MVISRRAFLAATAAFTGAGVVLPSPLASAKIDLPFGIQLYSVGTDLRKDFPGTLKRLAEMGYTDVELADTLGKPAAALRKAFAAAGLVCRSAHYGVDVLEKDLERTIVYAQDLGLRYMVCAFPRIADLKAPTRDEWLWHADFFNTVGRRIKRAGMQFAYHNHNMEFTLYGTRTGYDELLARTDSDSVKLELDCGWVAAAGLDPAVVLAQHPGRFRLLHVKDIKAGGVPNTALQIETTDIGAGVLEWRKIFAAAKTAGVTGYYVELEPASTPEPFEAARRSREYLAAL